MAGSLTADEIVRLPWCEFKICLEMLVCGVGRGLYIGDVGV
jgi:hypothetical protein